MIGYRSNRAAEEDMDTALCVDTGFRSRTPGYFERRKDRDFETFQPVPKSHLQSNKAKIVGPRKHRNSSATKTRHSDQINAKKIKKTKPKRNKTHRDR